MAPYQNVELSDPRLERDGLRFLTFRSPALGGRGDVAFFVPPGAASLQGLPLAILLHGIFGSHWAWALKAGAHLTALGMMDRREIRPMVLAMPSDGLWGEGSGYVPHAHADYSRWIMEDVPGCLAQVLPCLGPRILLTGLSMGGYGALRLGAAFPDRVAGISGHSSVTHLAQLAPFLQKPLPLAGGPEDPTHGVLPWILRAGAALPPLRFDCGRTDPYIEPNRVLHRELEGRGIHHVYEEFEGGHSWEYWGEHLKDSLRFFDRSGLI